MSDIDESSVAKKTVKKDRKVLISGVLILTLANLLVKIFGFLYKVPLNAVLGDEMANVNTAYSIYTTLLMISSAGIPSAVAVLVARARAVGDKSRVDKIFTVAMRALFTIGLLCSVLMLSLAKFISDKNSDGDSFFCMLAIAPALLFVCIMSVYRGYFQGFQIMTPTAISGIIEALGKMLLGLLLTLSAIYGFGYSKNIASAFSVLGITLGIVIGCLYLFFAKKIYAKRGKLDIESVSCGNTLTKGILKEILSIAFPIAVSSAMLSMASLVDSQMMRPLLAKFYNDDSVAKAVYSDYSTGAVTLFNMPSVLIYPIAMAIIPFITASIVAKDKRGISEVIESSFRISSVISLPCALGLSVLAAPILTLVFPSDDNMAANSGALLSVLSVSVFLIGILAVSNSVLQAFGKQKKPIISMLAGLFVKIAATLVLVPRIGPIGTPISTLLFYLVTVLFNLYFMLKHTGAVLSLKSVFVKPFLCASVSALSAGAVYVLTSNRLGNTLSVIFAVLTAVVVYLFAVFASGCVLDKDISKLPKGEKIEKFLNRIRLKKKYNK